jgi:hypothetical protein
MISIGKWGKFVTETIEPHPNHGRVLMPGKGWLIRFRQSDLTTQLVAAARAEIHNEHLLFLRSDGGLAALFLLEIVESWSETDL